MSNRKIDSGQAAPWSRCGIKGCLLESKDREQNQIGNYQG
jgi:hypothetical protein